jgi:hypothetical protein
MTEPKTLTVDVPGGNLRYDVRDAETESNEPVLLMIGYPMAASGFASLAEHFSDRTVVTYDPAGSTAASRRPWPGTRRRRIARRTCTD